jgi:hypothetical protein
MLKVQWDEVIIAAENGPSGISMLLCDYCYYKAAQASRGKKFKRPQFIKSPSYWLKWRESQIEKGSQRGEESTLRRSK